MSSKPKPKAIHIAPDEALIRIRDSKVFFDCAYIVPAFDSFEIMKISVQPLDFSLEGPEGVHSRDRIRTDLKVTFYLRVPREPEQILSVFESLGAEAASDRVKLRETFSSQFCEGLKTAMSRYEYEEAINRRSCLKDTIIESIGLELNGFQLEDVAVTRLQQTPLEYLDPKDPFDAEGIVRITDRTAHQHVKTNKIRRSVEKELERLKAL